MRVRLRQNGPVPAPEPVMSEAAPKRTSSSLAFTVLRRCALLLLLAGAPDAVAWAQATVHPGATSDTQATTASGHRFIVPKDWTLTRRGRAAILRAPEGDSWIALVETEAGNAKDAISQAWQNYADRPPPEPLMTVPLANGDGWVDGLNQVYRTPAGEPRQLTARALRNGDRWVVRIDDIANAVAGKRAADLSLIRDEFLPAGHVRESFAGRQAHALDAAKIEQLKAFIRQSQQALDVPGISIGVVQGGKVVYAGGFGVREAGHAEPVDADTLYLIASNTKSLTTLMLAKLVDEGRFRWDTPVTELMPAFALADAQATRQMQVRHLPCACAGLPYRNLDWEFAPPDSPASLVFDILPRMRPTSAFGASYQYTNPPAAAAGYVGAHALYPDMEIGAAYDRAMATRVFEPLGMTRTTFDFDRAMRGNYARSHGVGLDGRIARVDPRRDRQMHAVRPTGGAWSSVNDLLAYVKLELSGGKLDDGRRHLSESALGERWKPQISTGRHSWYGLGLDTDVSTGTVMRFHGGRLYGQRSNMVWWPEHDVGLVILMNASTGNVLMDAFPRKLMELLFDAEPEADSMVAAAVASERESREARRRAWDFPVKPEHAAVLASRYRNDLLGELRVENTGGNPVFHFAAFDMPMAARVNANGAVEFAGAIPSPPPPFVAGTSSTGRTLTLRDAQNEYVFMEME